MGDPGGGSDTPTDKVAEENARLAAEISNMQAKITPGATSPIRLMHKLPPPEVFTPELENVCNSCVLTHLMTLL